MEQAKAGGATLNEDEAHAPEIEEGPGEQPGTAKATVGVTVLVGLGQLLGEPWKSVVAITGPAMVLVGREVGQSVAADMGAGPGRAVLRRGMGDRQEQRGA